MIRFLVIFLLVFVPLDVFADGAADMHVQSAFLFAKRRDWSQAIAHAQAAHSKALVKYFTWCALKDPQSDAGFESITSFLEQNPQWPDKAILEKRAEVALMSNNLPDSTMAAWFAKHPPLTIQAKFREARTPEALHDLIREAWVNDDYDQTTEGRLLDKYHMVLRAQDHIRRIDRLLWEGRLEEAKRLLKYVPYDEQRLFQARISLAFDKQNAPVEVVNVPPSLRDDPGLLFERLRWRMRGGDRAGVRELLLSAPKAVPYPEKWWPIRDRQIREAVIENNIPLALNLLTNHGQKEGTTPYKEMQWLAGWIELEFMKQPGVAYKRFSALFKQMETPGGKARAAYWAGRAAQKGGNGNADNWYGEAAEYPTTFYGQLALHETEDDASFAVHSSAHPSAAEKERFRKRELVQLVYALAQAHESDAAERFIMYLVENAETPGEAVLAAQLGREIRRIDFSIRAAKKAMQHDIISVDSAYPVINTSSATQSGLERPLVLALIRQESEFYADAVSSSGAIGLMQLLPRTAKEIAKKNRLSFKSNRLYEPSYNLTLGSLYLSKMVEKFGGSYVLAAASYNAGPGRVGEWLDYFGRPGGDVHDVIDWIEKIPNSETRGYVEHVIENTEVYRSLLAGKATTLKVAEDLTR